MRQQGRRVSGDVFDFRYRETDAPLPRFAVVVPARVDKRATARNRMKRLVHESLAGLLPRLKPVDGIFVVKKHLPSTQKQVQTMVEALLEKALGVTKTT